MLLLTSTALGSVLQSLTNWSAVSCRNSAAPKSASILPRRQSKASTLGSWPQTTASREKKAIAIGTVFIFFTDNNLQLSCHTPSNPCKQQFIQGRAGAARAGWLVVGGALLNCKISSLIIELHPSRNLGRGLHQARVPRVLGTVTVPVTMECMFLISQTATSWLSEWISLSSLWLWSYCCIKCLVVVELEAKPIRSHNWSQKSLTLAQSKVTWLPTH